MDYDKRQGHTREIVFTEDVFKPHSLLFYYPTAFVEIPFTGGFLAV